MAAKRALVVDDSKSARAFLSRLLEKHHLDVDTAESAEQAIDYLTRHRPDVIFMDHLMPGMDGFQAVQAIKNNVRTATIPILMYTSQEGELYLGQARALGAVGVLPKQIRPADVFKVLQQLKLAGYAVDSDQPAAVTSAVEAIAQEAPDDEMGEITAELAELVVQPVTDVFRGHEDTRALREEVVGLRRLVLTSLENQSDHILEEVRGIVRDAQALQADTGGSARDWRGTFYGVAATVVAVVLAGLWLRGEVERRALQMQVAQLSATHAQQGEEPAVAAPAELAPSATPAEGGAPRSAVVVPAGPAVFAVPYGELALAGARVDRIRSVLGLLVQSGFHGVVDVQAMPGRFCLAGNPSDGYSLAAESAALGACELIGNPAEESLGATQRESLPFANMVAEFRTAHADAIDLRLMTGSADQVVRPYPDAGNSGRMVTAGEWNAAAAANNRVEVRWHTPN
jgi:CheY-like chemotaxis protein